jgi:general secretion pathway protein G
MPISPVVRQNLAHRSAGFTLLEMMVVVMIIGLLAAMVVPNLIGNKGKANQKKVVADLVALESALDMYHLDRNRYPTEQEGLQALVQPNQSGNVSGYVRRIPKDPWGNNYQYRNPGTHGHIDIFSYGEDGLKGGTGAAADIGNWNINDF